MPIETICNGCGQNLSVPDEHAGKQARCPACKTIYTVPHATFQSGSFAQDSGTSQGSGAKSEPHALDRVYEEEVPTPAPPESAASIGPTQPSGPTESIGLTESASVEASSTPTIDSPSSTVTDSATNSDSQVNPGDVQPTSKPDAFAETEPGRNSTAPPASSALTSEEFWMKTREGNVYGPVDRVNLNRWFNEGRVGIGYEIRKGSDGQWQPATQFHPQPSPAYGAPPAYQQPAAQPQNYSQVNTAYADGNAAQPVGASPYQARTPYGQGTPHAVRGSMYHYAKADSSGLVLTMGILSWVLMFACIGWVAGVVAWVMGRIAMKDIQEGKADPSNLTLVQVGYYLGMANVVLSLLAIIGFTAITAIRVITSY